MAKREMQVRWDVTANRWLERNKMPNGTALVLERIKDGRQVRGDTIIHRLKLPVAADAAATVADALEELRRRLITDIEARKQKLRLYNPRGEPISGNMLVGNVRKMAGIPKKPDVVQAAATEAEIEHFASGVCQELEINEELASTPEIVLRGYIQALRTRFSVEQITAAARA